MSLIIANSSNHWPGFSEIRRIFIFGDSFSATCFQADGWSENGHPNARQPLGVGWPGVHFNEPDLPNWVGHLLSKYCPLPRYNPDVDEQSEEWTKNPLLVYNYARGGDQVPGAIRQIRRLFIPIVGTKPPWAPWTARDSLFVTGVGINDCAYSKEHTEKIEALMDVQHELYQCGARNFLFFDLPPVDQAPAIAARRLRYGLDLYPDEETVFQRWNRQLVDGLYQFKETHPDCTILVFSLHEMFSAVLEDLETYGFPSSHRHISHGTVWMDHIHPTSAVHELIAHFLCDFLNEVPILPMGENDAPLDSESS